MNRVVIELTDRCNLNCRHCPDGRHGGRTNLPLGVIERIVQEARPCGFEEFAFTGGEPTLHPAFEDILRLVSTDGYSWGMVTNGLNFPSIYPNLRPWLSRLAAITFSLDGASEKTHDALRGRGAYRRVLQAISVCAVTGLPFTINMVLTRDNQHEIEAMAELASQLAARGLRFGHLMPTADSEEPLHLSLWERKLLEARVCSLTGRYPIAIGMAPGNFTTNLFPCGPLQGREVNVDCRGNLTKCCHLSGNQSREDSRDVAGNLLVDGFASLLGRLAGDNDEFRREKLARLNAGQLEEQDFSACGYCWRHYRKSNARPQTLMVIQDHPESSRC